MSKVWYLYYIDVIKALVNAMHSTRSRDLGNST